MGGFREKRVNQKVSPKEKPVSSKVVSQNSDPETYYHKHPAWGFNAVDDSAWAFTESNIGDLFWSEILPFFKSLETQTWNDILVGSKKNHHSIETASLNAVAQKRLAERYIEQDSIISLRITATHRLYGYMMGRTFNILWFDSGHGDNSTCVCRSYKKHT